MPKPAFLIGLLFGLFASLAVSGLAFMGPLNGKVDLLWLVPTLFGSAIGLLFILKVARQNPSFFAGALAGIFGGPLIAALCELGVWLAVRLVL
jgi:hypothetical protein